MPTNRVKLEYTGGALTVKAWGDDGVEHDITSVLAQSVTTLRPDGIRQDFDLSPTGLAGGHIDFRMPATSVEVTFEDVPNEAVAQLLVANGS